LVIDGEVVVPDDEGRPNFGWLQDDLAEGRTDRMLYYAFDLLWLDGFDIRAAPLVDRKRVLAGILEKPPHPMVRLRSAFPLRKGPRVSRRNFRKTWSKARPQDAMA
jgi:bifunctional non-homologous end joining protein LigD